MVDFGAIGFWSGSHYSELDARRRRARIRRQSLMRSLRSGESDRHQSDTIRSSTPTVVMRRTTTCVKADWPPFWSKSFFPRMRCKEFGKRENHKTTSCFIKGTARCALCGVARSRTCSMFAAVFIKKRRRRSLSSTRKETHTLQSDDPEWRGGRSNTGAP